MLIDTNTLSALQVFHKEPHPSTFKLGGAKEGLSLFGICNKAKVRIELVMLRGSAHNHIRLPWAVLSFADGLHSL